MLTPIDKQKAKGKGAPTPGQALAAPAQAVQGASGLPGMEGPALQPPEAKRALGKIRAKGLPKRPDETEVEEEE